MFRLNDFFHLPQLDPWLEQLTQIERGMILVAGVDQHLGGGRADSFLPSGRGAIFHILLDEILANNLTTRGVIITHDRKNFRLPREHARKFTYSEISQTQPNFAHLTATSLAKRNLLVIDRLTTETIPFALDTARGKRVLAQIDTISWGPNILRDFLGTGTSVEQLAGVAWIITVQRIPTLCSNCKHPYAPSNDQVKKLKIILPDLNTAGFYHAQGCSQCNGTGRRGDISVFDLFQFDPGALNPLSLLAKSRCNNMSSTSPPGDSSPSRMGWILKRANSNVHFR